MENYNPRQITRMRWKDAREPEKFIFISGPFGLTNEVLEHVSQDKLYERIIEVMNSYIPVLVYDTVNHKLYIGDVDQGTMYLTNLSENKMNSCVLDYDKENDKLTIHYTAETFISEDNVKTILGQSIFGTGNITMYRHQITVRFDMDTKEVHYTVYSPSKTQIIDYDSFIEVANPISNFNYTAVYLNSENNVETACIRFASDTILVGLSTGMEPFSGVADNVSKL